MEGLLVLAILAAILVIPALCMRWVFLPLSQAAAARRAVSQFCLADIFCLFFLVQLALSVIYVVVRARGDLSEAQWIIYPIAATPSYMLWRSAVRSLTAAGVDVVCHRSVILCLSIPLSLLCGIAVAVVVPIALLNLGIDGVLLIPILEVTLAAILWGLHCLTGRIVAEAENRRTAGEAGEEEAGEVSD